MVTAPQSVFQSLGISRHRLLLVCALLLLTACGGVNTAKPVYQGLLAEGAAPRKSVRAIAEIASAPGLVIVLSESTRDTIRLYKQPQTGPYVANYPADRWVADIAAPLKKINPSARIGSDLGDRAKGNWFVVLHWTTRFEPFVVGGGVEYHVLDDDLAQVAVFQASKSGSCDDWSINFNTQAVISRYIQCYDSFLSALIKQASDPLLAAAGK